MADAETNAWYWLMDLQRFDWKTVKNPRGVQGDAQVSIRMHPGAREGNSGIPYVTVLVSHPAQPDKRYKGTGNSLTVAVEDVHRELWRDGVKLPFPQLPDVAPKGGAR